MKTTSGATSSSGVKFGPRASRPLMIMRRAGRSRLTRPGPRSVWMTASDKDRIRDRPGDLGPLADGAPADRGARRLLQHHGVVAGLQHVAAALAREHRLGHRHAQPVL